jgi:hypothetical protein
MERHVYLQTVVSVSKHYSQRVCLVQTNVRDKRTGKSRMNNTETLETLGTQDTGRRQTNKNETKRLPNDGNISHDSVCQMS